MTLTQQTPQQRLAAAERAMAEARQRAEYHGWSGASGNAYVAARRELLAADRAVRAEREQAERQATEGRGAAAYAIIASATVAVIIAVLLLINAAHGGAF